MAELIRNDRSEYALNRNKFLQLFLSGLVGAFAMVLVGYVSGFLGPAIMDYAQMYVGMFTLDPAPYFSAPWWAGLFIHITVAAVGLPLLYDFLVDKRLLPNQPGAKGILFGGLLWFAFELLIKPLAGMGLFSRLTSNPLWFVVVNLFALLIYGVVLEAMSRVRMVHAINLEKEAA